MEAHLSDCPECQALRRQWEQLDERLAHTLAQPRLSPEFAARLRQKVALAPAAGASGGEARKSEGLGAHRIDAGIEARRRERRVFWLALLDGLGYGAAAMAGGYWLRTWVGCKFCRRRHRFSAQPGISVCPGGSRRRSAGRFEPGRQDGVALVGGNLRQRNAPKQGEPPARPVQDRKPP